MTQALSSFSGSSLPIPAISRRVWLALGIVILAGLGIATASLFAQVGGERGIAPIVSTTDIDVAGIEVDVSGKNAREAQEKGWQEAQRKAWAKINGPKLSDGQLQGLVSAIVIEREQIGPRRYIARLGVIFDRGRAGRYLGGRAQSRSSAPMLLLPVTKSGGTYLMYEKRNPWQQAWAEYQAGGSRVDYVRPSGAGSESLLLTHGQVSRRSRLWWRKILDQFEAGDVLVPVADLRYSWPGGPIEGTFTARYGPDNTYLGSFKMRASGNSELPEMLNKAVLKFDDIFEQALIEGKIEPDPTLNCAARVRDAAEARAAQAANSADSTSSESSSSSEETSTPEPTPTETATIVSSFVVQFASPDAGAIDSTLATVRSTSGVRGAATTSLAIGGTSVMTVSYSGSIDQLAAALRSRGFAVNQGSNALAISR